MCLYLQIYLEHNFLTNKSVIIKIITQYNLNIIEKLNQIKK